MNYLRRGERMVLRARVQGGPDWNCLLYMKGPPHSRTHSSRSCLRTKPAQINPVNIPALNGEELMSPHPWKRDCWLLMTSARASQFSLRVGPLSTIPQWTVPHSWLYKQYRLDSVGYQEEKEGRRKEEKQKEEEKKTQSGEGCGEVDLGGIK